MRRKPGIVIRNNGGRTILVPTGALVRDMKGFVILNETGRWVWERLDGVASATELSEAMTNEYEVTQAQALTDITEMLTQLTDAGVLLP
jgi:hypothetical protein